VVRLQKKKKMFNNMVEENSAFDAFRRTESSINALIALQIILSLVVFHYYASLYTTSTSFFAGVTASLLFIAPFCLGWGLVFLKACLLRQRNSAVEIYIPSVENIYVILSTAVGGLFILNRTLKGSCQDPNTFSLLFSFASCNPEATVHALPQDTVFILMLLPIISSIVLKGTDPTTISVSWAISTFFVILSIILSNSYNSIFFLCISAPLSALVLFELQRQCKSIFLLTERMKYLLNENAKMSEEIHANEMRHMIGNVAHDLKTVSYFLILCIVFNYFLF
jgi:hypothetical protein